MQMKLDELKKMSLDAKQQVSIATIFLIWHFTCMQFNAVKAFFDFKMLEYKKHL